MRINGFFASLLTSFVALTGSGLFHSGSSCIIYLPLGDSFDSLSRGACLVFSCGMVCPGSALPRASSVFVYSFGMVCPQQCAFTRFVGAVAHLYYSTVDSVGVCGCDLGSVDRGCVFDVGGMSTEGVIKGEGVKKKRYVTG